MIFLLGLILIFITNCSINHLIIRNSDIKLDESQILIIGDSHTRRAKKIKTNMGYNVSDYISLGDKLKISQRVLAEFFIVGDYKVENNNYTLNVKLY